MKTYNFITVGLIDRSKRRRKVNGKFCSLRFVEIQQRKNKLTTLQLFRVIHYIKHVWIII